MISRFLLFLMMDPFFVKNGDLISENTGSNMIMVQMFYIYFPYGIESCLDHIDKHV